MIILDTVKYELIKDKKTYKIGSVQCKLLSLLCNNEVCSLDDIAKFVYDLDSIDEYNIKDIRDITKTNICRLRRKYRFRYNYKS